MLGLLRVTWLGITPALSNEWCTVSLGCLWGMRWAHTVFWAPRGRRTACWAYFFLCQGGFCYSRVQLASG